MTDYTPELVYMDLLELLEELKLTQGPLAVSSTLNRHPRLKSLILDIQKEKIKFLETQCDKCYNHI